MADLLKDIQYAFRTLLKDKTLSIVAVLALAIGTGANTAIFSVINAVLLRPLPYNEPERVTFVWGTNSIRQIYENPISIRDLYDYRAQNESFEGLASYTYDDFNLSRGNQPERVQGSLVAANFFSVLGVKIAQGGDFSSAADQAGAERVAIISDGLWKRYFGAEQKAIGEVVQINGGGFRIIGVAPADFKAPDAADEIWIPISFDGSDALRVPSNVAVDYVKDPTLSRRFNFLLVVGRLKPNVSISQAEADMMAIAGRLQKDYPKTNAGRGIRVLSMHEKLVGNTRPALTLLLAAVGLVLLIACANVANLLLARAAARQKEIAIRVALGATRARLIRQLMTESLVLGLIGGALGLALGFGGLKLLLALDPPKLPRLGDVSVDASVLLFTLLISILTAFIFGLVPALQASRPNLNEVLKEGGKGAPASSLRRRVRNAIVISEVALTQILLISAALMLKSFISLQSVNPGLNPDNVLTMQMMLPTMNYSKLNPETESYDRDTNSIIDFYDDALGHIQSTPGVEAAATITYLPLASDARNERDFQVEGRPQSPDEKFSAQLDQVSEDYFNVMGIARIEGRAFQQTDNLDSTPVAIVNRTLAERFWPGANAGASAKNAIGKRIIVAGLTDSEERDTLEIIGVVNDIKYSKLSDSSSFMQVYVPYRQLPEIYTAIVVRTSTAPLSMANAVQQAIRQKAPDQPVYAVKSMQAVISDSISGPRLYMALLAVFGTIALLLAAIGIYGVMSYSVTQRRQEIGIRLALGARAGDILKMVIRQGMALALIGTLIGIAMALALALLASKLWSGLLATLLFGVAPVDLMTYVVIPSLLAAVALVSIFIPAIRAARVDPVIALRYE